MGESVDHFQQQQPHQTASRLGSRITGGEIVEVQGGHIVKSIGRKDRHSKVCTAKGTRDRRVRLSAHTAIQFYDVQDRLGYDRPSKAVDWLINKAKNAIDELAELPAWTPTTNLTESSNLSQEQPQKRRAEHHENQDLHPPEQLGVHRSDVVLGGVAAGPSSKRAMTMLPNECKPQDLHQHAAFLPPSLDSGSVSDTIKSFFPMGASGEGNSSRMQFQGFPPPEFLSRTSSQSQDLKLTLQSFQDPISLQHHVPQTQPQGSTNLTESQSHLQAHALFSGASHLGYEMSGWSEHQQPAEIGRFQRPNAWSSSGDGPNRGGAAGAYLLNSQPMQLPFLLGQNQVFSQRGPLQSSIAPSIRAWMDPSMLAIATADHNIQQNQHHQAVHPNYPTSLSTIGFTSGLGGFSGSRVPARIQGEGEDHDGFSDNPSSASSDSRH